MIHNERLVRACRRQEVDRAPVWMMRQAGRYLAEYRDVRARVPFLELCKTPELAARVSLQPYEILGVDAVIIFSDILIPAEAMGMALALNEKGPQLADPVRAMERVTRLRVTDPSESVPFVFDTIRVLRKELNDEIPLIGFAGAPFTLATYMIEGGASKNLAEVKRLLYREPDTMHALLGKIAEATILYLNAQIEAGVHVVQLFDTWAGELSLEHYSEFAHRYQQQVFQSLHRGPEGLGVPAILYVNECAAILELMATSGANVLSIDWRINLDDARKRVGDKLALQGNLDPGALLGTPESIAGQVDEMMRRGGDVGYVVNLGHGILPMTPVENARAFVDTAKKGIKEVA